MMTYEQAKAHMNALRAKQSRYQEEMKERSDYVKQVLGYERASNDATFVLLKILVESNAREIEAFKPILNAYPEANVSDAPHKNMWSNLSDPEKCTLALIELEVGKTRFMELCKAGYETSRRRSALEKQRNAKQTEMPEQPSEHDAFEKMMRTNRNDYASKNL